MRWIIDGYNAILADQKLSKLLRNDSEAARDEFLREIAGSVRLRNDKVVLVYDGRYSTPEEEITPNIQVEFSTLHETADDLIKKHVANSRRRGSLSVVTNDHAILDYARECGARVLSSQDFLSLIRETRSTMNALSEFFTEKPEPTGTPDPELLKLFGENKK